MDEMIGQLIRLGYTVGLAQDHSENPDTEVNHVYTVSGYGIETHVADEEAMRAFVGSHDERMREMNLSDEERLAEARSSAE